MARWCRFEVPPLTRRNALHRLASPGHPLHLLPVFVVNCHSHRAPADKLTAQGETIDAIRIAALLKAAEFAERDVLRAAGRAFRIAQTRVRLLTLRGPGDHLGINFEMHSAHGTPPYCQRLNPHDHYTQY
jgi:hypothetical protein